MNKIQKNSRSLRVYERSDLYIQSLAIYIPVFRTKATDNKYLPTRWEVGAFMNGEFWWARDADLLKKGFDNWLKKWETDEQEWSHFINTFTADCNQLITNAKQSKKINLETVKNSSLKKMYSETIQKCGEFLLYAEYTVDQFDDFFAQNFNNTINEHAKQKPSKEQIIQLLTPATLSANANFRKEMLQLSLQETSNNLHGLIEKFSWFKMSWDGSGELTESEIKTELLSLQKNNPADNKTELENLINHERDVKNNRGKILATLEIESSIIKKYFELLDSFNVMHDLRKEVQMRCNQIIFRILNEVAQRTKIDYQTLMLYLPEEIETLMEKNKPINEIDFEQRKIGATWIIDDQNRKYTFTVGHEAVKLRDTLILEPTRSNQKTSVKGLPASAGYVKNRAFVTRSAKQANQKIKKGEILITSMTTIDFIPAIQRAGGIITDDGGATCHAAVVSRELKKPAIVGTKCATQIFKTGDLVELNAEKGEVALIDETKNPE